MTYLTKWLLVLWLINASQAMGIQNVIQQPSKMLGPFGNKDQILKIMNAQPPQFEAIPPVPPDYPIPAFLGGMPYASNDFNLQYQQQFMPPIRLDIQFMPPPLYRLVPRPFMPLPPQMPAMPASYPFVLAPLITAAKNNTTSTPPDTMTVKDDTKGNKTRRSVGFTFAPRFYVVEDTETKVIDTWKETKDFRFFTNKWWKGNAAKPQINYVKMSNLKQFKNKHLPTLQKLKTGSLKLVTKGPELPKKVKNVRRIVPLKKDVLREVTAKLKQLKAQGKLTPLVGKLLKYEYDKYGAISKIVDLHTPLKEDKVNFIDKQ